MVKDKTDESKKRKIDEYVEAKAKNIIIKKFNNFFLDYESRLGFADIRVVKLYEDGRKFEDIIEELRERIVAYYLEDYIDIEFNSLFNNIPVKDSVNKLEFTQGDGSLFT